MKMTPHRQAVILADEFLRGDFCEASVSAYLRARREIDGAVMCVVPEKYKTTIADGEYVRGVMVGFNVCVATTLASAEAPDADV